MKHKTLTLLSFILASVALSFNFGAARASAQTAGPRPVRFIAIGDAGFANDGQRAVARKIEEVCAARGCDFALYLGDNFYNNGVETGAYDPQFEEKFETPFRGVRVPFYAALGNHDASLAVGGDGKDNADGDHQVAYHYRRDRASERWRMPARYYTARHGDVQVFAIDTNAILTEGTGTSDPGSTKQRAWLQAAMAASKATWKIVFGHHTYVSNGGHGNAGDYRAIPEPHGLGEQLKTFLEETSCGRADFYFCGHDHHLEWLAPVAACGRTQFIVSGAGSDPRAVGSKINEFYFQRASTFGFWWVEAAGDTLRAAAYDSLPGSAPLFEKAVTKTVGP